MAGKIMVIHGRFARTLTALALLCLLALPGAMPEAQATPPSQPSTVADNSEQRWFVEEVEDSESDVDVAPAGAVFQSKRDAVEHDLELWASARDVSVTAARAAMTHEAALDEVLAVMGQRHSDVFAGAFTKHDDDGVASSTIRVKGQVPEDVMVLVEDAGLDIRVIGGSPASWTEMTAVAQHTSAYLHDVQGLASTVMARASEDGVQVWIPHMSARNFEVLQQQTVEGVAQRMADDASINLDVSADLGASTADPSRHYAEQRVWFEMARPGVDLRNAGEHTYGGGEAEDGGARECTTAFTVNLPNGGTGVLTAAHCHGIDGYDDQNTAPYAMPWWSEHVGANGDLEVHTSSHVEPDDFWADAGVMRDVSSVQGAWTFNEGDSACVYGRRTNDRDCTSDVMSPYICYFPDSRRACNVIAMDAHVTAPGDSGGNWSWGNQAYGVHSGREPNLEVSVWTPVNLVSRQWSGMWVRV